MWFYYSGKFPLDAHKMLCVDPDQIAPSELVWSEPTLHGQALIMVELYFD